MNRIALSVKQPWAWLLVHGWKNVENRVWKTNVRGPLLIHASKSMTRADYDACRIFVDGAMAWDAIQVPAFEDLPRGGIVGEVNVLDCVDWLDSAWFCGPYGLVVAEARPLPFTPCQGHQRFFYVPYVTSEGRRACIGNVE